MRQVHTLGYSVAALCLAAAFAPAQVLQDGDMVIAANGVDGFQNFYGIFYRLRGTVVVPLFTSGQDGVGFALPGHVIIDSEGRIVFDSVGCGNNGNSGPLLRYDPATGHLSQLLCLPYIVSGSPPPGMPQDAVGFYGLNGLHASRSLKVSIDDDVNGGVPQVSFQEAYGFSAAVQHAGSGQYHAEAFRYIVAEDRVERGISTSLIPPGGDQGVVMAAGNGATYYAYDNKIGRAGPDLTVNLRVHTRFAGADITVQGTLRVDPENRIILGPGVI